MNMLKTILPSVFLIWGCMQQVSSALAAVHVPANHNDISYMGRIHWDEQGHGSFNYPGTTALLRFKGTALDMETSPGSGKFIVEIDNGKPEQIVYSSVDSLLTIAKNLTDSIHTARITYAIEGFEFNPQFRSFVIDGELLPANHKSDLKIEFIGNSITCGYGIEDENPANDFSYDTENHTLTYAYQAARELNADFNVVARSGIGIYRNYGGPREGDSIMTMPIEYDNTMLYNHGYKWDHSSFEPDIICINLGTNDTSEGNYDISLFESHYRTFLSHLRDLHPDAKIVLLTGAMLQDPDLSKVKGVLDLLATEYDGIYRFDMSPQMGDLGYGASYHPSKAQADKMASELIPFLKELIKENQ